MEDLPIPVQVELRDARAAMVFDEGWDMAVNPTTHQWCAYYARLGPTAREFLVENLLHYAQLGSACVQSDHVAGAQAAWEQLRQVVLLHNARVDEVTALRAHIDVLEGRAPGPAIDEVPDQALYQGAGEDQP